VLPLPPLNGELGRFPDPPPLPPSSPCEELKPYPPAPPPAEVIVVISVPEIELSEPDKPLGAEPGGAVGDPAPPSPTVTVIVEPIGTSCVDVLSPPAPPPPDAMYEDKHHFLHLHQR
jgi:hypothetical protein